MIAIDLDLTVYPLAVVEQALLAYQGIADLTLKRLDRQTAHLETSGQGRCDEALVTDEFLNYLVAMTVKHTPEP